MRGNRSRTATDYLRTTEPAATTLIRVDAPAIKALRLQLGLTQDEFAKRLGVTRQTLANVEQRRREPSGKIKRRFYQIWEVEQRKKQRRSDPRHATILARLNL